MSYRITQRGSKTKFFQIYSILNQSIKIDAMIQVAYWEEKSLEKYQFVESLNLCNREICMIYECIWDLCEIPKHFYTSLTLYSHNLFFYFFKEKNASLNSFTDITFFGWVVACLLMFSLKLLLDVPISFVKFVFCHLLSSAKRCFSLGDFFISFVIQGLSKSLVFIYLFIFFHRK